ncbi:MAG: putative zinc-binding metallopeptidase [Actinomycetes bacterium]
MPTTGRPRRTWLLVASAALVALAVGFASGVVLASFDAPYQTLVTYEVVDGELGQADTYPVSDGYLDARDDTARHREIWEAWGLVAVDPWAELVVLFDLSSDGRDNDLGAVYLLDETRERWALEVDPADAGDPELLLDTLVHELGHLVSLGPDQVEAGQGFATIAEARAECDGPGVEDGCLLDGAHLAAFMEAFWDPAELDEVDARVPVEDRDAAATERFDADPDRWVSPYAATHPVEDFAESWLTFVRLGDELDEHDSAWAEKARWFAGRPELRDAAEEIRARL